ncbi:MAG: hypothetical protein M3314_09755 [Actinomycetota bacterium]|nr:hypothetical protein [Actinomycetota bacterium]
MPWTRVTRCAGRAVLFVALAVAGLGWAETSGEIRAPDRAVGLTQPPGLAIDASLPGRSDVLTAGWVEQRLLKARVRLGLAVLVGLTLALAAAPVRTTWPPHAPRPTLWRLGSAARRAPPLLRLA